MVRVIYSGLFLCYNFFTLCERIEIMTKKRIALKIVRRVGICILTTVVLLLIGLLGVVRIMEFGPSKTARNLFVNSAMETSAGGILVTLFFSDEEIARIRAMTLFERTALIFFFGLQGKDVDFQCVGSCCFHGTGKVCPF